MYWLQGIIFLVSFCLTYVLILYGKRDVPNGRSSHTVPTSRSGGIAVVGSMGIGWSFLCEIPHSAFFLSGVLGFAFLGFIDDIYSLSPRLRLAFQALCASLLAWGALTPVPSLLMLLFLFTLVLWIIAFVNIFNFMDGLNGMAGLCSLVYVFFLSLLCFDMPVALCLGAALAGFLFWNVQGKIFLGDGGGYFLGAFFAAYPFYKWSLHEYNSELIFSFLNIMILYGLYLFDTGVTLITRLIQGKNILEAHKEHLYQRLQQTGWSHLKVSCLYAGISFIQGALMVWASLPIGVLIGFLMVIYGMYYVWVMGRFRKMERVL